MNIKASVTHCALPPSFSHVVLHIHEAKLNQKCLATKFFVIKIKFEPILVKIITSIFVEMKMTRTYFFAAYWFNQF